VGVTRLAGDADLAAGGGGDLLERAAGPVKVPTCRRVSSRPMMGQICPVLVSLGDADEQHQPIEDDVGADAFFEQV
jgi:hypothetical protein